jgi:hypothetical protein
MIRRVAASASPAGILPSGGLALRLACFSPELLLEGFGLGALALCHAPRAAVAEPNRRP